MTVQKVYAQQEPPTGFKKSLFLAGPTPRSADVASWRPYALRVLQEMEYDGVVFIPEDEDGKWKENYIGQCDWETKYLRMADDIVFWVPRDLDTLPGYTTNVEFGRWMESGKVSYGAPKDAPKVKYFEYHCRRLNMPAFASLEQVLAHSLEKLGAGAWREGAEREVPLMVWRSPQFQNWYRQLIAAGNRLDGANLEWSFPVGKGRRHPFLVALHTNVFIAAEGRNKTNEVVLMRPDTSAVLLYRRAATLEDTQIVLVREFRSTVANPSGFVWELPSGSADDVSLLPGEVAAEEVEEETGLVLDPLRFVEVYTRQLAATFATHRSTLFAAELSADEMEELAGKSGQAFGLYEEGDADKSERTYVHVTRFGKLLDGSIHVDFSTLGMIFEGLNQAA